MNISNWNRTTVPGWSPPIQNTPSYSPPASTRDGYAGTIPLPFVTSPPFPMTVPAAPARPSTHAYWAPTLQSSTAPSPTFSAPASSSETSAPEPTPAPRPDHSGLLRSLEGIKSTAGDAGYQAGRLADSLNYAQSSQPKTDADAAAWTLRSAESDTETTDSSSYGKDAQSKLDSISTMLGNLSSGSAQVGSLSSAISSIRGLLSSIDRSQLKDPSRLDNISSSLSSLEGSLTGAQRSVSQVDGSASSARYSLSQGGYYIAQVSADQEGTNVASAAGSARGYVETLSGNLDGVRGNAKDGGDSLQSMQSGFGNIAGDADALLHQVKWA